MKINYGTRDLTDMRPFYNSDVRTAISHICSKDMFVIIIVASVLAYTIPDVVPVAYADNTLYVSAESDMFENHFVGAQVIEVIVANDQYTNRNVSFMPTVTVNNNPLLMVQAQSGNWYGYFVEMDKAKVASANGAIYYGEMTEIQYDFSTVLNLYLLEWPFDEAYGHYALKEPAVGHLIFGEYYYSGTPILAYSFTEGDDVEVKLHNGASTESVTLRYDTVEDYAGLLLDRGTYPQNAHVHIAITDTWLNIDPTSEDIWTMTTGDDPSLYYGVDNVGDVAVDTFDLMCDVNCVLIVNKDLQNQGDVLELSPNFDRYRLTDTDIEQFSIRFGEVSPNSGVFTNSDDYGGANVVITDTARRGTTATIDYNDSPIDIAVANSFARIDIQLQDDTWNSGEEIPVIIEDDDANRNGAWSESMVVSDPKSIIPTLVIGSPITLDDNSMYSTGDDNYMSTETTTFSKRGSVSVDGNTLVLHYDGQPLNLLDHGPDFEGFIYFNYHFESLTEDSVSVTLTNADSVDAVVADNCMTDNIGMTLDCLVVAGAITSSQSDDILDFDEIPDFGSDACSATLVDDGDAIGYLNVDDALGMLDNCNDNDDIVLVVNGMLEGDHAPVVADFMAFGYTDDGVQGSERVADQIIRIEAEETDDNTGVFEGSLEYIMVNQLNVLDQDTYDSVDPISDAPIFIVFEDMTDENAPKVTYLDLGADGVYTQISDSQDVPSHSGVVTFDSGNYKIADTVTVTLNDPDLNTDSELIDIYTVVRDSDSSVFGKVGSDLGVKETFGDLGRLLDITFDNWDWPSASNCDFNGNADGLQATGFSLVETGVATGIFTGDFQIPAEWCYDGWLESTAGYDIQVNYVDFRDESGDIMEVGDSSAVGAHTGSVSLDRTVYPVPFGLPENFGHDKDHEADPDNESFFPIHSTGFDGDSGLKYINAGDLTIHVRVTDTDYDVSATSQDTISQAVEGTDHTGPVKVMVKRGSSYLVLGYAGGPEETGDRAGFLKTDSDTVRQFGPIQEIAPDAGVFEIDIELAYTDGPSSGDCPITAPDGYPDYLTDDGYDDKRFATSAHFCILQGDTLEVEYRDPLDASGDPNTVTDSATFDLRNGVLQSDKSQYVIGTDMILTLIEPDFDLDNDQAETYDLDLIEWDSDAATLTMGDSGGEDTAFDPVPMYFIETGDSTGIFQTIIRIPTELEGDALDRGEVITLEYVDWGPADANYVGDADKNIRLVVSTTDFGATMELDKKVYTWTDKVYITLVSSDHNYDSDLVDEIGDTSTYPLKISTRGYALDRYKLVETGTDTGIFTGEIVLTGFLAHDADGDGVQNDADGETGGDGPTGGRLQTANDDSLSVSFEYGEGITVTTSALIHWSIGEVQWLEPSYSVNGAGVVQVIDPDMNLHPEYVDNFEVNVWSDSDAGGIDLTVSETNRATGVFEGIVHFTTEETSGNHLKVAEGDTVTAGYEDRTLPDPYDIRDDLDVTDTALIGSTVISAVGETVVLNTKGSSVPGCEVTNDCFVPPVVTINMGEKIVWKNVDTAAHTVTSGVLADGGPDGVFDSGLFVPDTEFSYTFDTLGEYPYFCLVHPWMAGMIVVQETVDDTPSGQPYVNIENNFFMEFPKEWSVQNMYGADQPTVAAVGSSIGVIPPSIAVYVEEAGSRTLNTVRESKLADLETLEGNLEILNHELVSINSFDAFVLDATYVFDPGTVLTDIKYREATIVSSGKIYTLLFSTALSDFDSYVHHFTESLESFGIIMRESDESPPQRTIRETDLRLEFYDSKGNHYVWTLPISAYEDAVFESRLKSTFLALNPLRLDMDDGETITTTRLDGFVRGSFDNVIDNVYDNSYDNADFIWEVWHVVSQLTVYDADVYLHSEGRFATETFSRGGGDCEDLAILIADMLASSEHTADWSIQYLYMDTDNPKDPQKVNHVMLHVDDGVRTYLIEATGEPSWDYYPDGVRGWFIDVQD